MKRGKMQLSAGLVLISLIIFIGVETGAKHQNKHRHKEVDLFAHILKHNGTRGITSDSPKTLRLSEKWKSNVFVKKNFRKFWKNYHNQLTLFVSGHFEPESKTVPFFTVFHRRKTLPFLDLSINIKQRKLVIRYQGKVSFQRESVQIGINPVIQFTSILLHLNKTQLDVSIGCDSILKLQLRQPIAWIPPSSKISLGDPKARQKFTGVLQEAKVFNYINTDIKPSACLNIAEIQNDDHGLTPYANNASLNPQLYDVLASLEAENEHLRKTLQSFDDCVCYPQCNVDGLVYNDGESWNQGQCTQCTCQRGHAECHPEITSSNCTAPCSNSPCQHDGICQDVGMEGYHCLCPPPFDGPTCEIKQNPCVWPVEPGSCNETVLRYYYDRFSESCLPFNYTGCGGNVNNYLTLDSCMEVAMKGACCFRRFRSMIEDLVEGDQSVEYKCEVLSVKECKGIHRSQAGAYDMEVIGFSPSKQCAEVSCSPPKSTCVYDGREYQPGEQLFQGCQDCVCESDGQWTCKCAVPSERKEIRDMTRNDLIKFFLAIRRLRLSGQGNAWEQFRDTYMTHRMHSHGGAFFLPWHRLFLRRLEQKLQEIDCSIVLPYFDFTTDAGYFEEAILWQPNFFGGNGDESTSCVPDHPFGTSGSWRPCITRKFDRWVPLPSLVELTYALSHDDYMDMSTALESYVSYLHRYIGGDMATPGSPYDPVFYAIHAYIDMLYWQWQQWGNNKNKFPAAYGNIPMIPFNIPPRSVLDLQNDLCVTYYPPSKGHPCNITSNGNIPAVITGPGAGNRGDIPANDVNFDQTGYENGLDRRGYDEYGFFKNGFNRDGYNREGYDYDGFNRYGLDKQGYSRYGYDVNGIDRDGNMDNTGRYDEEGYDDFCLNREGLNRDGFDKYGFNKNGMDLFRCTFYYGGPFAPLQSYKIWEILSLQSPNFLASITRLCPGLDKIPQAYFDQYWVSNPKDVTGIVPTLSTMETLSIPDARFCFDTLPYLTSCVCESRITSCLVNPCSEAVCPSFPEANCHINYCTECTAVWFYQNRIVDCHGYRDFCEPNPCQNGGTCLASIWPSEPSMVTCQCPPGYDGHRCQHEVRDVCSLPVNTGQCDQQETRWFYNTRSQTCEEFVYLGCAGNANNFASYRDCQARCMIGACCFRKPLQKKRTIGYDMDGYDRYGFNMEGVNRNEENRTLNNGLQHGSDLYDENGYDWQGFGLDGYNAEGFERLGYDREGYDREGFNILGYSREGDFDGIIDYDKGGYNLEGFSRSGMNCQGYNRRGLNFYGVTDGYSYQCRSMTLTQCQTAESRREHEVVRFSPGKSCDEVHCEENCGCRLGNRTYHFGEMFMRGCQQCTCTVRGNVECKCTKVNKRKEVRDMTKEEMEKYIAAIKYLSCRTNDENSRWFQLAQMYAEYKPQSSGNDAFLPWHRYFLRFVEQELQAVDCSVTIPYYDWTTDVGHMTKSIIWGANMFGGNGESSTDCVVHHPFKDFFPPYWVPCLRRRFNTSISLPDAINFHLMLREKDFTSFRLQLEVAANLFQSWVGGQMASDMAPYDPLFLSHMAFIDRMWYEWQGRFEDGLLRYPPELRYIPLEPFGATADDVFDSIRQMCIEYVPLSEGALCNVTLNVYGFDENGYDRHGYDREGFDHDGFDIRGYNRQGEEDTRGIYNQFGFDRQGYNRMGYDTMGIDRYGFFEDAFNIDGFDSSGYDRSGYDRYGFSRNGVTPFAFHKNGSWLSEEHRRLYDSQGYNKYGFNTYGFNREGYDVFGYSSLGFDRNRCNRHYLGPTYIVIKRWIDMEVEQLENITVDIVTRICPPISSLPEWIFINNWMTRSKQKALTMKFQRQMERLHPVNPSYVPRISSVTEDRLWIPIAPDSRFCFETYYFSQCPFSNPPVTCREDLCRDRLCPSVPDAVCRVNNCGGCNVEWYNVVTGNVIECSGCVDERGMEHLDGTTWSASECTVCSCQLGRISCSETVCPPVNCKYPFKMPGVCCSTCDAGCFYNGNLYEQGQRFDDPLQQCRSCVCNNGDIECQRKPCIGLDPECQSRIILEGDCCPTCMDCGSHTNGSSWKQSPCRKCTCVNGKTECERIQCRRPQCNHPYTPEGECCAQCDACLYEGRQLDNGQGLRKDACTSCLCVDGTVTCTEEACQVPQCNNPITLPGQCCPLCDLDCEYEGQTYRHNANFTASYDSCLSCTCDNSMVKCRPIRCPPHNLPCRNPIKNGPGCCDYGCPKCMSGGQEYSSGERWRSPTDPCQVCTCNEGYVSCTPIRDQCQVTCTHGIIPRNQCCSDCTDCLFESRRYSDGQRFARPGDACHQCTCTGGNVRCNLVGPCPPLPCSVTETQPGACCPRCKGCDYEGELYQYGDTVRADRCSSCVCREGQVQCRRVECSPPACKNPVTVEGECCPVCQECTYEGRRYRDGQRFTSPSNQCETCTCSEGEVTCRRAAIDCPPVSCNHPETAPGECCPTCGGCTFLNRRFRNGQKFVPPGGDACHVCTCQNGTVNCGKIDCPVPNCLNPVKPMGQCCEVCPVQCTILGKDFREGQRFGDPNDPCSQCVCKNGRPQCQTNLCPPCNCSHPAIQPGDCCPSCFMCQYENKLLRNGQSYSPPNDPCTRCVCQDGNVVCTVVDCPQTNCITPRREQGQCCATCPEDDCRINGVQYNEGEKFTNPRDPCQECMCVGGRSDCRARACYESRCNHPVFVPGQCCPQCTDCTYEGLIFKDGQTFEHPMQKCQTCTCNKGNVRCLGNTCDRARCQHPATVDCCPVCEDCLYDRIRYRNGQTFRSSQDSCLSCTCRYGNVRCEASNCTAVTCQHPVQGGCCQECNDCFYQNRRVKNGQQFRDFENDCHSCLCREGTVTCEQKPCPEISCAYPTLGDQCCPECRDCMYENQLIRNGLRAQSKFDPCLECLCRNGDVSCQPRRCPAVTCINPVKRDCCNECSDCLFNGKEIRNGDRFRDPNDGCSECQCVDGNVQCKRKSCEPVSCNCPVVEGCCPICGDCFYRNKFIGNGERFSDDQDPCLECRCQDGNIHCAKRHCPTPQCSNPVQGSCCLQCGSQCASDGRQYGDGERFRRNCQECECRGGSVSCQPLRCPATRCRNPVFDGCCQTCTDCEYNGRRLLNGQSVKDSADPCVECNCINGSVNCASAQCKRVTCRYPIQGQCCEECTDCNYNGRIIRHSDSITDACTTCTCRFGDVRCERKECNTVQTCSNPVIDSCGCAKCDACSYNGVTYRNGNAFDHAQDPCQQCQCINGNVQCLRIQCLETCTHPLTSVDCCPDCRGCFYEGQVYRDRQTFQSSSDPCKQCECRSGNVICNQPTCGLPECSVPLETRPGECCPSCPVPDRSSNLVAVCTFAGRDYLDGTQFKNPEDNCQDCICSNGNVVCSSIYCSVPCSNPHYEPGACCPSCDHCEFEGQVHRNGVSFKPDDCRTCSCQEGNVVCLETSCPTLTCAEKQLIPGHCCETCKVEACESNGLRYHEGDKWQKQDEPCVTCICKAGVVTCVEIQCLPACDRPVTMPGQCCPVCRTCYHGGITYSDGEKFSPTGDPCDVCLCQSGYLSCHHETCPSVASCPSEHIVPAPPGLCCPTCSSVGRNCSLENVGQRIQPELGDPCLYCDCTDSQQWNCAHKKCPQRNCPPNVQKTKPGECCPTCPACYDRIKNSYHDEGETWTEKDDPCNICLCKNGGISCDTVSCPSMTCPTGQTKVKLPGECCGMCRGQDEIQPCEYKGKTYRTAEEWVADECTTCSCSQGTITCNTVVCPEPNCGANGVPVRAPGACCPTCVQRPGTCLVYGDPHYQSFDGELIHFQGTCRYIMASDCTDGTFVVEVQHDRRGSAMEVSWAQNFTIRLRDTRIDILQNNVVMVSGQSVSLPFINEPMYSLEEADGTVILNTDFGLQFSWNGNSYAELKVPGNFMGKTCGLCGNFNGFPQDDLRTKSGIVTPFPSVFGNSWKAEEQLGPTCDDARDVDACAEAGYRARKLATAKCAVIRGPVFSRCHRTVSPDKFYDSCMYDMCVCGDNNTCLCEILSSYAHECSKAGITLLWRSSSLCPFNCDESKGLVFDECGPVCARTCENYKSPLGDLSGHCYKPCVASCQCPANKVLHEGQCIDGDQCPSIVHETTQPDRQ